MILGISIPNGAKAIVLKESNKVLLVFDEEITKRDLWKVKFDLWLTEGTKQDDFFEYPAKDHRTIEITHSKKISI